MTDMDLSRLGPVLAELMPRGRTALLPALHAAQAQRAIGGVLAAAKGAELRRGVARAISRRGR